MEPYCVCGSFGSVWDDTDRKYRCPDCGRPINCEGPKVRNLEARVAELEERLRWIRDNTPAQHDPDGWDAEDYRMWAQSVAHDALGNGSNKKGELR